MAATLGADRHDTPIAMHSAVAARLARVFLDRSLRILVLAC
jgi:hypothetical protein